jgi:hypothetical protein
MSALEFRSKQCKDHMHQYCVGRWQGYGFQVNCRCNCHITEGDEM